VDGVGAHAPRAGRSGELDAEAFAAHVDSPFLFEMPDADVPPVPLVLGLVETIGDGGDGQWFALTFVCGAGTPLPSDSYDVTHDVLGSLRMLVSPTGLLDDGRGLYEAIFDRREVSWSSPAARS
jgi:hypothetical protein